MRATVRSTPIRGQSSRCVPSDSEKTPKVISRPEMGYWHYIGPDGEIFALGRIRQPIDLHSPGPQRQKPGLGRSPLAHREMSRDRRSQARRGSPDRRSSGPDRGDVSDAMQ